jgi:hypothetical protein
MDRPARLTSDLLARKGGAQPIRRSGATTLLSTVDQRVGSRRRALLRNCESDAPRIAAQRTPVVMAEVQSEPLDHERKRRIALTLRLDPTRHMRLKILAARRERTSHDLLMEALDGLLEAGGRECSCLRTLS